MNPILQAALGSILRFFLAMGAGYLVKAGVWTGSDAETYVTAAALGLLTLGWSLWNKYKERQKLLTAIALPNLATEEEVVAHIADGKPTPPVTTPIDVTPVPTELK